MTVAGVLAASLTSGGAPQSTTSNEISFVIFVIPCDLILPQVGYVCYMQARDGPWQVEKYVNRYQLYLYDELLKVNIYSLRSDERGFTGSQAPHALFSHFECSDHTFILD